MPRLLHIIALILGAVLLAITVSVASAGDVKPTATASIETKAVAVGVGYSWGDGVLTFQGKNYPFKIKGLSVIDVGISSVSAQGDVYYLNDVKDFAGTFTAAEAGAAVGGGVGAQIMQNQNGIVMKITSKKAGIQFKLAPEGLKVEMQ